MWNIKSIVDCISLSYSEEEAHCLCGENRAGKSSPIRILSGAYQTDEDGEVVSEGKKVKPNPRLVQCP